MTQTRQTPAASRLFEPARLGGLELSSRLVMAPLTRNRAGADGVPGELMATHYAQRASAGLIIAEGTTPNAVGQTYPHIPGIHTPAQIAGWRRVTEAVRAAGGRMFLQLQHGGRVGHPDTSGHVPLAPSAVRFPEPLQTPGGPREGVIPRVMAEEDVRSTIADFAGAARNAVEAGFDGVEVHSANGHLLHQFLAGNTNLRTDAWGGSVANRIRFPVEVVRAVAEAVGPQRVGVRISPGTNVNGVREEDTELLYPALVAALAEVGPAYLHQVHSDPDQPLFAEIRGAWPGTLIANPRLSHEELAADAGFLKGERLLAAGADLVALGRGFLANPDLVERLRTGAPLNALRPEFLMHVQGAEGYNDYPALAPAPALALA
ncbi:alkene reductase [Streptomyces lavendulae]|uniref:alkene reductase n=1 Tax=Streptomyces lavendulae TaxID=1914 RepID=UPI0024A3C796|nr:alkene reductase [Streptomyces lavendulae]GLX19340.1 alkene reductase [Streptomyces lavendulae subsp. lavendulae]GLX30983.1 alkene reductase [Streptomyces lavendulae subsp. lavendulae]